MKLPTLEITHDHWPASKISNIICKGTFWWVPLAHLAIPHACAICCTRLLPQKRNLGSWAARNWGRKWSRCLCPLHGFPPTGVFVSACVFVHANWLNVVSVCTLWVWPLYASVAIYVLHYDLITLTHSPTAWSMSPLSGLPTSKSLIQALHFPMTNLSPMVPHHASQAYTYVHKANIGIVIAHFVSPYNRPNTSHDNDASDHLRG